MPVQDSLEASLQDNEVYKVSQSRIIEYCSELNENQMPNTFEILLTTCHREKWRFPNQFQWNGQLMNVSVSKREAYVGNSSEWFEPSIKLVRRKYDGSY